MYVILRKSLLALFFLVTLVVLGYFFTQRLGNPLKLWTKDSRHNLTAINQNPNSNIAPGFNVVSITGKLEKVYRENGSNYLVLSLINFNEKIKVIVDLGEDDSIINILGGEEADSSNIIIEKISVASAKYIAEKYNSELGAMLTVELLTSVRTNLPDNCDRNCQIKLEMFRRYEKNNNKLYESDFGKEIRVGMVTLLKEENQ